MRKENYVCIHGWMRELGLKGAELMIYAVIYGFSQTEDQKYTGGMKYLTEWCGTSKQTVITGLKSLVERGLIIREERVVNGVKFFDYRSNNLNGGGQKILPGGGQNFLPHNKDKENIIEKEREKTTKRDAVISYTENEELRTALWDLVSMRKEMKKPMTERAIALMLKRLDGMAKTDADKIAIVNQSIERGWQTVYPLKDKKDMDNKSFDPEEMFREALKRGHA